MIPLWKSPMKLPVGATRGATRWSYPLELLEACKAGALAKIQSTLNKNIYFLRFRNIFMMFCFLGLLVSKN